ncbi:uncharacterized protein MELLADRAFT_64002 [Melampsora larici-populina 98AG31]|uniref:SPX domain-containing protein n=1 Tax=Melampsora larici-populina (strain 98AG31 / pathotype 3-4-7) TaxID=747676 RepID=F4RPT4_MELLP|nr:uncharacterized protein MELLADRAFT_64002 [Melampsora larici-populina 98AG31]EGG05603.1 hypothetical protein MELLADRAFT_64002 [Melampsora larici-populina 98AG31]
MHHALIPELRALAFHDRVPTSPAVQVNTPQRTGRFRIYVQGALEQGFYHNIEDGISQHLETYRFLNTLELEAISDTINTLEDEIHDIGVTLSESQDAIAYVPMLLRSRDPEVVPHHQLYKRQLKISRKKYKRFMRTLDRYHKEIANLRAIHSQER